MIDAYAYYHVLVVALAVVNHLAASVASVHLAPPATPLKGAASSVTVRSPPKRLDGVEVGPGMDPWLLQREELQRKLLSAGSRVLVTAPPAAGKTSLIQLLKLHPKPSGCQGAACEHAARSSLALS